jgi:hypothetical protein
MSKADKLRGKLASMQRDREEFEKQKKELEAQMDIGRQNMGKIQKGLKNNLMLNDPIVLETTQPILQLTETVTNSISTSMNVKKSARGKSAMGMNANTTQGNGSNNNANNQGNNGNASGDSPNPAANMIIPTGTRISDWCFVGALDSTPPVVKSQELYENVRLLGRGSFGEVNLAKNVEDNRL